MQDLFKRKINLAVVIWSVLMSAFAVYAQERSVGVRVKGANNQTKEEILYRNSYAMLIGNSDYFEWNALPGVERDILQVEAVLRDRHGFVVEKALNLSKTELLNRIDRFISKYGQSYENRLLIYYAGHGYTAVLRDGRIMGYLVMKDAPAVPMVEESVLKTPENLGDFRLKAISMGEIENLAKEISTRHALFVFDSCFSGTILYRDNAVTVPKEISTEELKQMRGFLTAGNEKQRVRDDSPFRRAFIKGLEGKADTDGDGYILSTELGAFVKKEVYLETRDSGMLQTPVFGKPEGFRRGDMIFVAPKSSAVNSTLTAASIADQALDEIIRGNYKEADRLANKTLQLQDNSALAIGVRGWVKYIFDDYKAAQTDLEKAIRLDSSNALFRARLAICYSALDQKDLSQKTANEALQLLTTPKTAIDYYARGVSYSLLEKTDNAISDYTKVIELNPQFVLAYYNRGATYHNKKDYSEAIADYTKVIELNPQYANPYKYRGDIYLSMQNYNEAIRNYTKAIELSSNDVSSDHIYFNRGNAYFYKSDYDKAIDDYTHSIELNPKNVVTYIVRGNAYRIKQNYDAAIRDFTKAIELSPQDADIYEKRAICYDKTARKDLAEADRRKAEELKKKP